jgi:hypothetical protein
MAAPLDPTSKTRSMVLKSSERWFADVDEWRRRQPDIPNVSESIRRLVTQALEAERSIITKRPSST